MSAVRLVALLLVLVPAALAFAFRPQFHYRLGTADCCLRIAHAGGAMNGIPYTNSPEALDESYAKGWRVFEIDFSLTGDGSLVLAHDYNDFDQPPATVAEFLARPTTTGASRIDFAGYVAWLKAHPDVVTVTDTKFANGPQTIAAALEAEFTADEIARRFVFQLYDFDQLTSTGLVQKGYQALLTLYLIPEKTEVEVAAAVADGKVIAVTMPIWTGLGAVRSMRKALPEGMPLYLHGDPGDINRYVTQTIFVALGASGFYVD